MKAKWTVMAVLAFLSAATVASAQTDQELAAAAQRAAISAQVTQVDATIVGIDAGNRTLMLHGDNGVTVPVVIGREVGNFEQFGIGDHVRVFFKNALVMKGVKASSADTGVRKRVETEIINPSMNSAGFGAVRQVEMTATVQSIDYQKKTITLRGAERSDTFDLSPEMAADKLRPGDTMHAVFVSATAIQVMSQPAAPEPAR
jgi:hypothetical protein